MGMKIGIGVIAALLLAGCSGDSANELANKAEASGDPVGYILDSSADDRTKVMAFARADIPPKVQYDGAAEARRQARVGIEAIAENGSDAEVASMIEAMKSQRD